MLSSGVAPSPKDLPKVRQDGFAPWLRKKVINSRDEGNYYIRMAGVMPSKQAYFYDGYEVNGYRFHTESCGENKVTQSSGVCIKGEWDANGVQIDYYGLLQDVCELQYDAHTVVLFRCDWFDIINGVKVDRKYGLVEVKHASRLANYEPFVLAAQATQVCYLPYALQKAERKLWWVAMKASPKSMFCTEGDDVNLEFYQEERPENPIEPTIGEDFDWEGVVQQEGEFEVVTEDNIEEEEGEEEQVDEDFDDSSEEY
ncbi:uncharacterized protein LOC144556130 [Carex rostrata]